MASLAHAATQAAEHVAEHVVAQAATGGPVSSSLPAGAGGSGQVVRGVVEQGAAALPHGLDKVVENAVELTRQGLGAAAQAAGRFADTLADNLDGGLAGQAAARAAEHGTGLGGSSFSWGGYAQAVGILFLLVALLWLVVWVVRRFGKFNFLPRPGALPKGALVMEAQLPLGPRKGLMVVRFLNRRLLLGVTDQHITLLTEEQAQHEPQDKDFKHIMEEAARSTDSR